MADVIATEQLPELDGVGFLNIVSFLYLVDIKVVVNPGHPP